VKPSQIALSGFARRLWEVAFGSWLWFPSRSGREEGLFSYLEGFYNGTRIDASPGYRSPAEFEEATMEKGKAT
jgi:hypothetical protein